ncbi:hypothetical protein [uncultured Ezakiella sp.]|uniref:hypothetical protein n=1 Tax=uncultured Ezakiella sp. TaxID=1637529 RepID=UPI0025F8BEE6|nr:hypothetical protein [uncultured Ezakiella sp.]
MDSYNLHNNMYTNTKDRRSSLGVDYFISDRNKEMLKFEGFKYTSYKRFTNDMKRILGRYNVSIMNITKVVSMFYDDINSLDLKLNILGYNKAYFDFISINEVEEMALNKLEIERLSNYNYLYEYEYEDREVLELKAFLKRELLKKKKNKETIKKIVNSFSRKQLKPFIFDLNNHFDSQYVMVENGIEPEETDISRENLNQVYLKTKDCICKNANDIFFDAYWKALNQRVLERYK